MEKEYITWKQFDIAIDKMVDEYRFRKYNCECVHGIPRGGLPFAVALSHKLELPFLQKIQTEYVTRNKILLTDDIADSGGTLDLYRDYFSNRIIFTMHYHKQSKTIPDFWVYEKTDKWIVYPWEVK